MLSLLRTVLRHFSFFGLHPVQQWGQVASFILKQQWYPSFLARWYYATPMEARALEHVVSTTKPGNAEAVLRALDEFAKKDFLMNIGDEKGPILTDVIKDRQPKVVLELGTYLGYSAIEIARHLPPGAKLYSIEVNPLNAAIADKLIDWAGYRDRVQIVIGSSSEVIRELRQKYAITSLDVVFFDHWKDLYLPDLKILEQTGLFVRGKTVIVGDNVLFPGAPDFLKYISETQAASPDRTHRAGSGQVEKDQKSEDGKNGHCASSVYLYDTKQINTHLEYLPHVKDLVTVSLVL